VNLQSKNKSQHRHQTSTPKNEHKLILAKSSTEQSTIVDRQSSSKCYQKQLERHIQDLEARVDQKCQSIPKAELCWLGSLDLIPELFRSQPIPTTSMTTLLALFKRIKQHQQVIVLDFGWSRFVVFMTSQHWGFIPNLHPNNSWKLQVQDLQKLLESVRGLQIAIKSDSRDSMRLLALQRKLDDALLSGQQFREKVRVAMFEELKNLCSDQNVIITESLDVARLYTNPSKCKTIDDLDWWHLLEHLEGMVGQQQKVVILDRNYKSQTCPACSDSSFGNRQGKYFKCKQCGIEIDPDLVALLNLWQKWLETPEIQKVRKCTTK
jgi:hypothetical protein